MSPDEPVRNRLPLLVLCLIALVLLSPGLVGHLAARHLDDNLRWVDAENEDIEITSLGFERRWFTSTARHRLVFKSAASTNGPAAVLINTELTHGLIPFAVGTSGERSFTPALATAVSTLLFEPASGESIDIPGSVYSRLSLLGNATFHYAAASGQRQAQGVTAEWEGADVRVSSSAAKRTLGLNGRIDPLRVTAPGAELRVSGVRFASERDAADYAFGVGHIELRLDDANVSAADGLSATAKALAFGIDSKLNRDTLHGVANLHVDELFAERLGSVDVDGELAFDGVDAATVSRTVQMIQHRYADGGGGPDAPLDGALLPTLQAMLQHGGRLELNRLDGVLNQGRLRSSGFVEWPAVAALDSFSWPSLILRTKARAQLEMDAELYTLLAERVPQISSLVALGVLQQSGQRYEMAVELNGGLLEVNGAPMPLSGFL